MSNIVDQNIKTDAYKAHNKDRGSTYIVLNKLIKHVFVYVGLIYSNKGCLVAFFYYRD